MSSGFVKTDIPRSPDRVRSRLGTQVRLPDECGVGTPIVRDFSLKDVKFSNPVASYRSGPQFDRAARSPGAILGNTYASEVLQEARGDIGHEFSMRKVTQMLGDTSCKRVHSDLPPALMKMTYPLTIFPQVADLRSPQSLNMADAIDPNYGFVMSDSELATLGTSFIKSTNPIQSQVNLLSSIAEAVTDGTLLPGLLGKQIVSSAITPGKRRDLVRAAGSEYLNYIFGYKPLADDIAKVGVLLDTVNTYVDQWIKDNGTIVRRRRKIPRDPRTLDGKTVSYNLNSQSMGLFSFAPRPGFTSSWGKGIDTPGYSIGFGGSLQRGRIDCVGLSATRLTEEINFSAAYEYDFTRLYTPTGGESAADLMHNAALRNDLKAIVFGLDPGSIFTAAYDATPFSWLLDWFVNLGDIIDNFRGLQTRGVQLLWGYISQTAIRDHYMEYRMTYKPTGEVFLRTNGLFAQKSIRRVRATPFGFGLSYAGLTSSQQATLGALAASKLPEVQLAHPGRR